MKVEFLSSSELTDQQFVSNLYHVLLGRDPDPGGLAGVQWQLANGTPRKDIVLQFINSPEFQSRLARYRKPPKPLPNLLAMRPEKYSRSGEFVVFGSAQDGDFDWLETAIKDYGFYERPGPWGYGINRDKVILASLVASLGTSRMFEIGCGDGGVIACASRLGVSGAGLDISAHSKSLARPEIRESILLGDLLDVDGLPRVDLICAFDLIEHISPNKVDRFIEKLRGLLDDGGVAIFNTPAFGEDRVFGLIHSYWIAEWRGEGNKGRLWRHFPCDEMGFPLMGHLIWADSTWWERLFERHGLHRLDAVERRLHIKFDPLMQNSPARKSYFVVGNHVSDLQVQSLCASVDKFDFDKATAACADLVT